jgi:uncharacterized protein (TIGR03118 family)
MGGEIFVMKTILVRTIRKAALALAVALLTTAVASRALAAQTFLYTQTNLTSNLPNQAANQDPNLQNAWGVAFLPSTVFPGGSPFWLSDNNSGLSTLYDAAGALVAPPVNIPSPTSMTGGTPTGLVSNLNIVTDPTANDFMSDVFIFDTEDGTIVGWQTPSMTFNTQAIVRVDNSHSGAVYKGLAIANDSDGDSHLYATNFNSGAVDVFDFDYSANTTLPGKFVDPKLPKGFAPFGIELINGNLWVSYAKQDNAKHDPVNMRGNGFVDIFTTDGMFVRRFASRGQLNSPWGMMMAPSNFGVAANQVLIGDFGDGHINVYTPNGFPRGQLQTQKGFLLRPLVIDGLWKLINGNGAAGVTTDTVYFSAGPNHETNGLFGTISPSTFKFVKRNPMM